jgi:hypothetical protein
VTPRRVFPEVRTKGDAYGIAHVRRSTGTQRATNRSELVIGAPGYRARLRAQSDLTLRPRRRPFAPLLLTGAATLALVAAVGVGARMLTNEPSARVTFALVPAEPAWNSVVVTPASEPGGPEAPGRAAAAPALVVSADEDTEETPIASAAQSGSQPSPVQSPPAPSPTTAPPPPAAPAAPAAAPAAQGPLSEAEFRTLALAAGWPSGLLDEVVAIARCESGLRPDAVGYGAYGLMQMTPWWFEAAGFGFEAWSDPVTNLKTALYLYTLSVEAGSSGWHHWGCSP